MCSKLNHGSYLTEIERVNRHISDIDSHFLEIKKYMNKTNKILNDAVFGHDKAKRQIERIMNNG